jgi:hypothetical protein
MEDLKMHDMTQELLVRLRFSAMDTLNRDIQRADARKAADWITAALSREAGLRDALERAKDYVEYASNGHLLYRRRAEISSMAVDDLALIHAALRLPP